MPTELAPQQLTQQVASKLDVRLLPLIIVASISGTMNWASFWLFQGLVWIGLVPLVVLIKLPIKRWKVYLAAYVGGLCWFVPAMSWLRFTADEGWIAWLLMGFYLAVYYPLFILLARILHRGLKLPMTLAFPIAWTVIEYARMHMLSGMGWFLLAHSIYDWTSTIQIADLGGVYAVSFLVALVNGWWADLLSQPLIARPATTTPSDSTMSAASKSADDTNVRLHPGVIWRTAVMLVMMMANSYYGKYRLDEFQATTKPGPTVGLVQINLPQSIKNGDSQQTWDHVWAATRPLATSNVDFVVWPETCYPWPFGSIDNATTDEQLVEAFTKLGQARLAEGQTHAEFAKAVRDADHANTKGMAEVSQQLKRPIVASAIMYSVAPGRYDQYNCSVAVDPKQGIVGIYNKRHLVPFGEYVPFMRFLDLVRFLLPYDDGIVPMLTHGDQARILTIGPWKLGCLICFEDTLPAEAQAYFVPARKGPVPDEERSLVPDILVNQSNDGWFRGSIESDYHLAAAIFRTIETRRPMLRAANMAYTAYVDSAGRVVNKLPKLEVGQLIAEVKLDSRVAPYIALGDWLPFVCLVIVGVALLARLMSFRRSAREQTVQQG